MDRQTFKRRVMDVLLGSDSEDMSDWLAGKVADEIIDLLPPAFFKTAHAVVGADTRELLAITLRELAADIEKKLDVGGGGSMNYGEMDWNTDETEEGDYPFRIVQDVVTAELAARELTEGRTIRMEHGPFYAEATRQGHRGFKVTTDDGDLDPEESARYVDGAKTAWNEFRTPDEAFQAMRKYLDEARGA